MITNETTFHLYLKQTIQKAHQELDKQPILSALQGDVSVEEYGNALAALHGFYANVEKNVMTFFANETIFFDYQSRLKTPLLEHDLKMLGKTPFVPKIEFPTPKNVAELVGMIYVLEGSTMGGQFLAQKIGNKFPIHFFTGYGANTAQKWQEFWAFANSVCTVEEYDAVAKMAILLFELLTLHLQNSLSVDASESKIEC